MHEPSEVVTGGIVTLLDLTEVPESRWQGMALPVLREAGVVEARFEAGQGFAAGLEARPRAWLRLRAGADLQTLTANATARYTAVSQGIDEVTDSLTFTVQSRAWWLSLRGETGVRGPGGVWLWAGGGGGWFDGGIDRSVSRSGDVVLRVTVAGPDRWVWSASVRVARGLQPFLPWPIGIDVRARWLLRKNDAFDPWTIRVAWMRP